MRYEEEDNIWGERTDIPESEHRGTFRKLSNFVLQLSIVTAADKLRCKASTGLHCVGESWAVSE